LTAQRHFVGVGLMRTADPPASIRAIVGPGLAIVALSRATGRGGILHLSASHSQDATFQALVARRLRALVRELGGADPRGLEAYTFGVADLVGAVPLHSQTRLAEEAIDGLRPLLDEVGLRLVRSETGGNAARSIALDLPSGTVSVKPVGGRSSPGLPGIHSPPRRGQSGRRPRSSRLLIPDHVVNMGCIEVQPAPSRLVAVLGSCVGITLFDPVAAVGGLAHIMMPRQDGRGGEPGRYADRAVPVLIAKLQDKGAVKQRLKAKLIGGANVLGDGGAQLLQIGQQNIAASREALQEAEVPIIEEDVGGNLGRKIFVDLPSFDVAVKLLGTRRNDET